MVIPRQHVSKESTQRSFELNIKFTEQSNKIYGPPNYNHNFFLRLKKKKKCPPSPLGRLEVRPKINPNFFNHVSSQHHFILISVQVMLVP